MPAWRAIKLRLNIADFKTKIVSMADNRIPAKFSKSKAKVARRAGNQTGAQFRKSNN